MENLPKIEYGPDNICHVKDKNGYTMKMIKPCDGILFPDIFSKPIELVLKEIQEFESRPDDVIMASYPKSGK